MTPKAIIIIAILAIVLIACTIFLNQEEKAHGETAARFWKERERANHLFDERLELQHKVKVLQHANASLEKENAALKESVAEKEKYIDTWIYS